MDPGKGRGRGLALLQALKKSQNIDSSSSDEPSPETTPGASATPSVVSLRNYWSKDSLSRNMV